MKNMWKYAMLLAAASGLFACEDPEVGEALPDYYSKTFVTIQTSGSSDLIEGEVENTLVGVVPKGQYDRQVVISLTRELSSDLTVEIAPDPSLLAARAEADGVEYKELPAAACVIDTESVVIPAGERQAVVSLTFGDTSFAAATENTEVYMLPLVITKVSNASVTISKQQPAVYCKVTASYGLMRKITSPSEIIGSVEAPSGWTQQGGNNSIIDGNLSGSYWGMPRSTGNVVTIDMKEVKHVSGLGLKVYQYGVFNAGIEYSVDGQSWKSAGKIDQTTGYVVQGSAYGAFYGSIDARYLRLTLSEQSGYTAYRRIYEVMVYTSEFSEPYVYLTTSEPDNTVNASVLHTPAGTISSVSGTLTARVNMPSPDGYTVNFTVDNSLIAAYNAANGTSCVALPDGFLTIPECPIDAMAFSSAEIRPELTGNLSSLSGPAYLVPLRISIDGLKTSELNGIAYMLITAERNEFMSNPKPEDARGTKVADRSAFTALDYDYYDQLGRSLFDGNGDTCEYAMSTAVDLGATYNVSAVVLDYLNAYYGQYYRPVKLRISTSDDGDNWTVRGTVTEQFWHFGNSDSFLMVLSQSVRCRHVLVEMLQYGGQLYYGMAEFNIYAE